MGKKKKKEIMFRGEPLVDAIFMGTKLDSSEELEFACWCIEALEHGFISDWQFHKKSYVLSEPAKRLQIDYKKLKTKTKITIKDKSIFSGHVYSPDFKIRLTAEYYKHFNYEFLTFDQDGWVTIDTKGTFAKNDGGRSFAINRKWMFDKHRVYVNKVIPRAFFADTWVPHDARWQNKSYELKLKSYYVELPTIGSILNNQSDKHD